MTVEAQVTINGTKAAVWAAMTTIANAAEIISGIEKIEVVERPSTGLVGLKWRETRMLFGKPATVEKWITEVKENEYYTTRAEDSGFVFITTNRISGSDGSVTLTGIHETQPQGFAAKLKSLPMVFFKGMIKKAILQDLNDVKAAIEGGDWQPISREALGQLIEKELRDASSEHQAIFANAIVEPLKWQLSPWGDLGGGFWAIAIVEDRVLWYNDIEDGFNVSHFETFGEIPPSEYWCNQDELRWAIPALAGKQQGKFGPPEPLQ